MPITDDDVQKLKKVAVVLEKADFNVYVVLAKLAPFSKLEVQCAKQLNEKYRRTDRELEPYFIYERVEKEFKVRKHISSLNEMAQVTD